MVVMCKFRENCGEKMEEFLKRCFYHSGQYDSEENFAQLDKKLKEHEVVRFLIQLTGISYHFGVGESGCS